MMSICLQSMVDELMVKKSGGSIRKVNGTRDKQLCGCALLLCSGNKVSLGRKGKSLGSEVSAF